MAWTALKMEGAKANGMTAKDCIGCGLCRANCPVFRSVLSEAVSPRGKAALIKKDVIDSVFYQCTLCKACKVECPLGIGLELVKIRERLVKNGMETDANRRMIENVRRHGNPFGKIEEGTVPKEMHCC